MAETRKKNNAIAIDADAKNKSNRAMLLYEQLKKDLSVEGPSVFSAVLFLTCDILSNIPLKNISKETIDQRITFWGTKGAKFSNTVRQNVTQQLLEQLNLTRRPKEEVVKQILFLARYDDALLMEDFNQYRREICRRLDVSKQKLFKTICDMSCVLIRSDTEQLLFKNPEQRILDVEKNLHFKIDAPERETLKKMLFSFKLDRVKSVYQSKFMPHERAKNDFVILKKMCRQAFIEMAGNRGYRISDRKRNNNSQSRGR